MTVFSITKAQIMTVSKYNSKEFNMKIFLILQLFILLFFALPTFADTFYIITGEQQVELRVISKNRLHFAKTYILVKGEKLKLSQYERVCSKSDDSEYEVGIENRTAISLKKSYPCYYYVPSRSEKKGSVSEKFAVTFRWIKKKLLLESNVRKPIIAEGRADGDIEISKSQYPAIELKFDRNDDIEVTKLTIKYNDKIINEVIVNENSISMTDLKIGQRYIIEMIDKDGAISVEQQFVIVK